MTNIFLHQNNEAKVKKGFMKRYFITYRLQKLFYLAPLAPCPI